MMEFSNERTYALTPTDKKVLLETMVVEHTPGNPKLVILKALELAAGRDEQIDVHMHNQWWAPSYSCYPDGSVWRHATGRRQGWIIKPPV